MDIRSIVSKARKVAKVLIVPLWRRAMFNHGVAAGVEHRAVLLQLGPVRCVLDVGANRGQFALVARQCFPQARIVSFEPLAEPARIYRRVFAHDDNVLLFENAIGPRDESKIIHVSQRDDSSSLLPIAAAQTALFPGTSEVGTTVVEVRQLSACIQGSTIDSPALLKLDVQGFELQALAGCDEVLPHFSFIYVECSFLELYAGQAFADEVIAWLNLRGFRLRGIYNAMFDPNGRAIQADFLFGR